MLGFVDDGGPWRGEPALRHFEFLLYLGKGWVPGKSGLGSFAYWCSSLLGGWVGLGGVLGLVKLDAR